MGPDSNHRQFPTGETAMTRHRLFLFTTLLTLVAMPLAASEADDKKIVADLDTQYQLAVKNNDAATMDRILADDFVLITGRGKTFTKADLLQGTKDKIVYEHQEELSQAVRVWGDTAVVTALLWVKGADDGKPFDYKLWFSDVYMKTSKGWRYVLGQASLPLPPTP
jgi:ketosteroid isomerase-like protein